MQERTLRRRVLALTTILSFLTPFMINATNLAIPKISEDLKADAVAVNWVALIYLLATAALLVPMGRLADLYGRKKVFVLGTAIYAGASLLAALAPSIESLIVARAGQGIGGAMAGATAVAILVSVYPPEERGRVLGINVAAVYTGLSSGPVLGGLMIQHWGWRSIMGLVALISALVVPLALLWIRREWAEAAGQSFDWPGALFYGIALIAVMYGLSSLYEQPLSRWLLPAGVLGLLSFGWIEVHMAGRPLLDLRYFRGNRLFIISSLVALIQYLATSALTLLLSLYLQGIRNLGPQMAGLVLLAHPALMALFSPPAGRLSDRLEPHLLASLGIALTTGALLGFSFLQHDSPLLWVILLLGLMGIGFALFSSPNTNAIMGAVSRQEYGVASSVVGTMRSIGQSLSIAVTLLLFTIYVGRAEVSAEAMRQDPAIGLGLLNLMRFGLRLFAALAVGGLVLSLLRGRLRPQAGR